jgi:hypothetical protein
MATERAMENRVARYWDSSTWRGEFTVPVLYLHPGFLSNLAH